MTNFVVFQTVTQTDEPYKMICRDAHVVLYNRFLVMSVGVIVTLNINNTKSIT